MIAVLDSGVLIDWAAREYLGSTELDEPVRRRIMGIVSKHLAPDANYVLFQEWLGRIPDRRFASGALAEANARFYDSGGHAGPLRRKLIELLADADFRDVHVHLPSIDVNEAVELGFVDAAYIRLMRDLQSTGLAAELLTNDRAFRDACRNADIVALLPPELWGR